jgi:hypothetical protein
MTDIAKIATDLVSACARRDYAAAFQFADPMFAAGVSEFMLAETWNKLRQQAGDFKAITGTKTYRHLLAPIRAVYVQCKFERMEIEIQLGFSAKDQVIGHSVMALET